MAEWKCVNKSEPSTVQQNNKQQLLFFQLVLETLRSLEPT